jgi:hypothetical protein
VTKINLENRSQLGFHLHHKVDNYFNYPNPSYTEGFFILWVFISMKYIIREDRLVKLVDEYITSVVGELSIRNSSNIHATEEDFELIDKNRNLIFEYFGRHLGVSKNLFLTISELFGRSFSETEDLIQLWFEKKYPDEPVQAVYYSIYY